jgi:Tol biopolymer transport system component
MALASGTRLGPYEILSALGAGGMGEVYRARDTKLDRDVAIKVLPEAFAADPERIARFQREAKTLASLNHPHIATIHGIEESGGTHALVMELVEGEDLSQRIARGPIPIDEALAIAKQIAEALEAAHEQGIIHRDLKPANIKVTPDGVVKVLDFGLAKLAEAPAGTATGPSALSMSPTITSPAMMTGVGVLLGTAAYMAPEQAKGKPADKRSDIWAFGCVLYEMLTGKPPFGGGSVAEVVGAAIHTEPDWTALPPAARGIVEATIRRCLYKDAKHRIRDMGDVLLLLGGAFDIAAGTPPRSRHHQGVPLRVAVPLVVVIVAATAVIATRLRPSVAPEDRPGVGRLTLSLPSGTELDDNSSVAVSRDGTQIAYVASRSGIAQLYIRPIDRLDARVITDTRGAAKPFFSPDGQWLAFFANGKLKKVSTIGGVVVTLADANGAGTWGPDDTIVFGGSSLMTVPAGGGDVRPLLKNAQDTTRNIRSIEFLPGGAQLLIASTERGGRTKDDSTIDVLTIGTGQRKTLVRGSTQASYLPTGHLVFLRDGKLMAAPLDLERLALTGSPIEAIAGVRQQLYTGVGAFSCSRVGTCVYIAGGTAAARTIATVDRNGVVRTLPLAPGSYSSPRFSPSGDKIALWVEQLLCDVDVYDVVRGTLTRLTSDFDNHYPIWTPDGRQITYISSKGGAGYEIVSRPANGSGPEAPLSRSPLHLTALTPLSWSPAGVLALADRGDIRVLSRSGDGEPRPFEPSQFNEDTPAFSPDGRWLAFVSDESGRVEVYVRPYPGPGEKYSISTGGGSEPVWAHSGRELFFRNGDEIMAVDIRTTPTFSASRPRLLFTGGFARMAGHTNYDVSPDDQNFVMVNTGEEERVASQITVITNWFDELKRLVPTK